MTFPPWDLVRCQVFQIAKNLEEDSGSAPVADPALGHRELLSLSPRTTHEQSPLREEAHTNLSATAPPPALSPHPPSLRDPAP